MPRRPPPLRARALSRSSRLAPALLLLLAGSAASCAKDLDTSRNPATRGTIGQELYGVFCERIAAQALHEDLTGGSWQSFCHPDDSGKFADGIDESKLPSIDQAADKIDGGSAAPSEQKANRDYAKRRLAALGRNRDKLIAAFDATFPAIKIPGKDLANSDPKHTCDGTSADAQRSLGLELADMLGRLGPLYDDGTMPAGTEAMARVLDVLRKNGDALSVLQRAGGRGGYRPIATALGQAHAALSYPRIRDVSAQTMRQLSPDSDPYNPAPPLTPDGKRIPVPGVGQPPLTALLAAAREELRVQKPDDPLAALTTATDPVASRDILSRPRSTLEFLQSFLLATDPSFGPQSLPSQLVVKRDPRWFAALADPSTVASPFVDKNGDGLPDVDDKGRFITSDGSTPPTPFPVAGEDSAASRDAAGRATVNGQPVYGTIETNHTLLADLTANTKALVDSDVTHNHETLMNLLGGLPVVAGGRVAATKQYDADPDATNRYRLTHHGDDPPSDLSSQKVELPYSGFDPNNSPLLDLVWAFGQILGDRTMDDTLAASRQLLSDHTPKMARLIGDALAWKNVADTHPEARIAHPTSTFWDEMLDTVAKIAKEPGLLEDLLKSLGDDRGTAVGQILSGYMKFDDHITYDRGNLNGPAYNATTKSTATMKTAVDRTAADTGFARSAFHRFIVATHETRGVAACNKDKAKLHIRGAKAGSFGVPPITLPDDIPFSSDYKECEVFKIGDLGKFFVDSIIGKAVMYLRPDNLRNGYTVFGQHIGLPTVDVMQQSAGIVGFWGALETTDLRPKPQFLNRLVFFDLDNDSPDSGPNHLTNVYIRDLTGLHTGSSVCPERIIKDPIPTAQDASPDGLVHGLRSCKEGDWFDQRDKDATFVLEELGAIDPNASSGGKSLGALAPMIEAFAAHNREDLFLDVADVIAKHWQDDKGSAAECSSNPSDPNFCTRDGLVSYEPLLSETFAGDIFQALHDLVPILEQVTVPHCVATNGDGTCKQTIAMSGIDVMAESTRALVDPTRAAGIALTTRSGRKTGLRNDGNTNPQVTPMYLMTEALNEIDDAFAKWAMAHPDDAGRQIKWRLARSQLVDQFLSVTGAGASSAFKNKSFVKTSTVVTDLLRAQMLANCTQTWVPPYKLCTWAKLDLTSKVKASVSGPVFAGVIDLLDSLRRDDASRRELESLLAYMSDPASDSGNAFAAMVASGVDALQLFGNDKDIVPLYHLFAEALAPALKDGAGNVVRTGLVDANIAMLFRIAARAYDATGHEICAQEIDPNGVMNIALKNFMSPTKPSGGNPGKAPIDAVIDAVTDINRVAPEQTSRLDTKDYDNVAREVGDFLSNRESGLEQFYEIVRQGTE